MAMAVSPVEREPDPVGFRRSELLEDKRTKYFVITSNIGENVVKSVQHSVWATQRKNEQKLNDYFRTSRAVILIFSVNKSGAFQGYARMRSSTGHSRGKDPFNGFGRLFDVEWLRLTDLEVREVQHLRNTLDDNRQVGFSRDGQELAHEVGAELCRLVDIKVFREDPAAFEPVTDDPNYLHGNASAAQASPPRALPAVPSDERQRSRSPPSQNSVTSGTVAKAGGGAPPGMGPPPGAGTWRPPPMAGPPGYGYPYHQPPPGYSGPGGYPPPGYPPGIRPSVPPGGQEQEDKKEKKDRKKSSKGKDKAAPDFTNMSYEQYVQWFQQTQGGSSDSPFRPNGTGRELGPGPPDSWIGACTTTPKVENRSVVAAAAAAAPPIGRMQ